AQEASEMLTLDTRPGVEVRIFTSDGDWYFGAYKMECGGNVQAMVGVAVTPPKRCGFSTTPPFPTVCTVELTHRMICASRGLSVDQNRGYTLSFADHDDRRDVQEGDWSPGLYKGECG